MKNAFNCCNDNWKFDLVCSAGNDLNQVGKNREGIGTILNGLANSFQIFAKDFAKIENNYLHTPLLNNPIFGYGQRGQQHFNEQFFIAGNLEINKLIAKITWQDLTLTGELKNINEIGNILERDIAPGTYNGLKNGWKIARKKYNKEGTKGQSIVNFIKKNKKGSKQFRNILNSKNSLLSQQNIRKLAQVKTYALLTGSVNTPDARIRDMLGAWNNNSLPGKIRTFLFKFYNNILGINARVSKFNNTVDPGCTFCTLKNTRPVCKDLLHTFFTIVKRLIK